MQGITMQRVQAVAVLPAPHRAIAQLVRWLPPAPADALRFLDSILSSAGMLRLYRRLFPNAYHRSKASTHIPLVTSRGAAGRLETHCGFCAREWEFFGLVARRLFPLNVDWMEEIAAEEGRIECIYLDIPNPTAEEDGMEAYRLPMRAIAAMIGHFAAPDWEAIQDAADIDLPTPLTLQRAEDVSPPVRVHWKRFRRLCRHGSGPMRCVPELIDVVAHDSGNFWVDVDEESVGYHQFSWTEKEVRWLAREWRAAQEVFRRSNLAMGWLERKPQRLAAVIELWNHCVTKAEEV